MFSRHCSSVLRATTSNGKSLGNKKNISFAKLPATSKLPGVRATSLIPQGLRVRYLASSSMDGEKPNHVSIVEHPYSLNDVPLDQKQITEEGVPVPSLFAVISMSGTQFKITQDDTIRADYMDGYDIGDILTIDEVYLVGSRAGTVVGRPLIPGAKVRFEVEELTKDKKVIIFKMRRRKHSRRMRGFRADLTILRCKDIILPDQFAHSLLVSNSEEKQREVVIPTLA